MLDNRQNIFSHHANVSFTSTAIRAHGVRIQCPTNRDPRFLRDVSDQFWIHTRAIDRLGPLEWVLNTPSHHRVHHARNPKYLDKNYAGTLIIWDRMFGTYTDPESVPADEPLGLDYEISYARALLGLPAAVKN